MNIADFELDRFRNDIERIKVYREGVDRLRASGFFNFLRIFARPFSTDGGANVYQSAYSAAHAEGYARCLEDMEYFYERYLVEKVGPKAVKADFGGLGLAVKRGDIKAGEINGR